MSWLIEYNGEKKTTEDWGVSGLTIQRGSFVADQCSFRVLMDSDEDDLFAPLSTISIYKVNEDGSETRWFTGIVEDAENESSEDTEGQSYVVHGPWWYLEKLPFQQHWKYHSTTDPDSPLTEVFNSHLMLGLTVDGLYQNVAGVMREALQFVIDTALANSMPAPFAIGTIDLPNLIPPIYECVDRTCDEVITRMRKWCPDAVCYFDYAASPPTINIVQRSAQRQVSLRMAQYDARGKYIQPEEGQIDIKSFRLKPRKSLQAPSVLIKYESSNVVNGVSYPSLLTDAVPFGADGRKFGGLVSTINLNGSATTYAQAVIESVPIDPSTADFWINKVDFLGRSNVQNLTISNLERITDLPNELTSGEITQWMLTDGAQAVKETIRAVATFDIQSDDGSQVLERFVKLPLVAKVVSTDLGSGTYRTKNFQPGEVVPTGIAAFLYNSLNAVQYDGTILIEEDEVAGRVRVGDRINLFGSRKAYETMAAQVQQLTEDIDTGLTTVTVGPPKQLGKDDLVELLGINRTRQRFTDPSALSTGASAGIGPIELGKEMPGQDNLAGFGEIDRQVVGGGIVMDKAHLVYPSNATDVTTGQPFDPKSQVQLREVFQCMDMPDGTHKKARCLAQCSPPYFVPGDN